MRTTIAMALLVWCFCGGTLIAQTAGNIESEVPAFSSKLRGDEVTLRSGKSLQGIRVLSETQLEVKVEVLPGLPPLVLPASQVRSIRYESQPEADAPPPDTLSQEKATKARAELVPARKISPRFSKRLAAKMRKKATVFEDWDIIQILKTVAEEEKVSMKFSPGVLEHPLEGRRCSVSVGVGQSLDSFLQKTVSSKVPWIKIEYAFDEILVGLHTE